MYKTNIRRETLKNNNYRKVLFTTKQQQLVLMALKPSEDIPKEKHNGTQTIYIESGKGSAIVGKSKKLLKKGDILIIGPNTSHYIKNTGKQILKLYTIYSPPEHSYRLTQARQIL